MGAAAAAPPPATAAPPAALQPATPPLAESSDRSYATALTDSSIATASCGSSTITTASSSGSSSGSGASAGAEGDAGSDDSGTHNAAATPKCPRIRAIDAFVRHRSFTERDSDGDARPLRANSAGTPGLSSISLDVWLRSGSGSLAGRGASGRSSLSMDNWLRSSSAGSLDLPRGNAAGGGAGKPAGRSSLSCDFRRGSGGLDGNAFAHRSTPGRLDSVRSSLGGRPPTRFSVDGRCSVDVDRRRELLAASAAPLHLFKSELPHQVCHCRPQPWSQAARSAPAPFECCVWCSGYAAPEYAAPLGSGRDVTVSTYTMGSSELAATGALILPTDAWMLCRR